MRPLVSSPVSRVCNFRHLGHGAALLICGLMLVCPAGNSAQNGRGSPNHVTSPDELETRVAAAQAARESGDSAKIAVANQAVLAAGLRALGELKSAEGEYAEAARLFTHSLQFEDASAVYEPLGYAELQTGHLEAAISWAEKAHDANPKDLRAERLLASALDQNGDFVHALDAFERIARAEPSVDNLYPLAECLLQTRRAADRERAEQVFAQMRQTAGNSGSLHVLIGRAYRDGGDINRAIEEFKRALAVDPRTPHAHYFLGLAQLFARDWKASPEIEAEFLKEVELYPGDYLANYMLGTAKSGERDYKAAEKYLDAAARIDPASPDPVLFLGMNAFAEGDTARAETLLKRAIELTRQDEARTNYQIRRAYVDLARIEAQKGNEDESRKYAAKARELQNKVMGQTQQSVSRMLADRGDTDSAALVPVTHEQERKLDEESAHRARARWTPSQQAAADAREKALHSALALAANDLATSLAVQHNYSQALPLYKQAEQWDSTLPGIEKNLGLCAFRVKEYSDAARALQATLGQGETSPGVRAMLGLSYFGTEQYAAAAEAFAPLGTAGMRDAETGYAWAASLAHIGDAKKAAEVLTAYESEPRSNDVLLLMGQLWTEIGDFDRARATFDRALAADPQLARAHFYKGLACIRSEHWADAAREFQTELDRRPGDLDALYHLGFVDQQLSRVDKALALYLRVIEADPNYVTAQYEAGKILLDRGKYTDATAHLERAARLSPRKDYIHYQLQAAYRKLGRTDDADRELALYKELKTEARDRVASAVKQKTE